MRFVRLLEYSARSGNSEFSWTRSCLAGLQVRTALTLSLVASEAEQLPGALGLSSVHPRTSQHP